MIDLCSYIYQSSYIHTHFYILTYELAQYIRFYNKSFLCKWQRILRPPAPKATQQSPNPNKSPRIKVKTRIPSLGRSNDARHWKSSRFNNRIRSLKTASIASHSKQGFTLWSYIKLTLSKRIMCSTNPSAICSPCTWKKKKNEIKKYIRTSHSRSFRCSNSCWETRSPASKNAASANSSTRSRKTTRMSL